MNPYVTRVRPLTGFRIEVEFGNGELRVFDMEPYLDRGVFRRLRELSVFRGARVVAGSVEWPGEIDLSHDTLYLESQPIRSAVDTATPLAPADAGGRSE